MFYRLKTTSPSARFLLLTSDYAYCKPDNNPSPSEFDNSPRSTSVFGTDSYSRSLRRAFSRAKMLAFFNPDLTQFITLTYKQQNNTPEQVQSDLKRFIRLQRKNKKESLKYIYVLEYQKRGSIHVHMVANDVLDCELNKNGYLSVKGWHSGFTSVQQIHISKFDSDFKPYLYLFKYMSKAQRVGKSFIHCSRNFDKIEVVDYADYINELKKGNCLYKEDYQFEINDRSCRITKKYYRQEKN